LRGKRRLVYVGVAFNIFEEGELPELIVRRIHNKQLIIQFKIQ
jgi:hypothetical protein